MKRANKTTMTQPTFEPNMFYERIIALRKTQPRTFESLSPATKLSLGAYEQQKRQHAVDEAMRNEPAASGPHRRRGTTKMGSIPKPNYEVRFNPRHFEPSTNSGGKPIGLQEVSRQLPDGWQLCATVIQDEAGVHIRKAFARRGLRPDGTWQEHVGVGTYDVVAIEDAAVEKSQAESSDGLDRFAQRYMEEGYAHARKG